MRSSNEDDKKVWCFGGALVPRPVGEGPDNGKRGWGEDEQVEVKEEDTWKGAETTMRPPQFKKCENGLREPGDHAHGVIQEMPIV